MFPLFWHVLLQLTINLRSLIYTFKICVRILPGKVTVLLLSFCSGYLNLARKRI